MMAEERAHAVLSASGSSRWMSCTSAPLLEAEKPDESSPFAKEGTLAHELCEIKLRNYFYTEQFSKRKLNNRIKKMRELPEWSDEMMEHSDTYLQYVKDVAIACESEPYVVIEQKVMFDDAVPGGFGTADCIIIHRDTIHIIDFKYGVGVEVSPVENSQLMLYAAGALNAYGVLYPISRVVLHIVQPRTGNMDCWDTTVGHILEFKEKAKEKAHEAMQGGTFNPAEKTCRFCRIRDTCRARADKNVELAFSENAFKLPPEITPGEIGKYLEAGEDLSKWLEQLKEHAMKLLISGTKVPGYKIVEGRGKRVFEDTDAAFERLIKNGVPEEMLYERKMLTLAQAEKVVGKKEFNDIVGGLIRMQSGNPVLAKESDKRPEFHPAPDAKEAFG